MQLHRTRRTPPRTLALAFAATLPSLLQGPSRGADDHAAGPAASAISAELDRILEGPPDRLWSDLRAFREKAELLAEGRTLLERLSGEVHGLSGARKLGAAALLYSSRDPGHARSGQVALQQIARSEAPAPQRIAAIRLLRRPPRAVEAALTLRLLIDQERSPEIIREASLALWALDSHPSVRAPLIRLLASPDGEERAEAALALAQTGHFAEPVAGILAALREEPSERGKLAEVLHAAASRFAASSYPQRSSGARSPGGAEPPPAPLAAGGAPYGWGDVLAEAAGLIQRHSLPGARMPLRELYLGALRGMANTLDEYSTFQDPEERQVSESARLGTYWGIGADLIQIARDAPLVVERAHRMGPAHEAGLRTGDRILEVNGVPTSGRDPGELERLTSGEPGETLHLVVRSWGSDGPRIVVLARGTVEIPTLEARLIEGGVGLLRLRRVGPRTAAEFERAYDQLAAEGADAFVLDLRGNPGGNLKQAVRIVDLFVGLRREPIISETAAGRETSVYANPDEKPPRPMAVLVDRATASAAEVIAGALQDFGLATVVGEATFGKGTKLSTFPLSRKAQELLGGDARLVVTTAHIQLPLGRPLQAERTEEGLRRGGGVLPDISAASGAASARAAVLTPEALRVQHSEQLDAFVRRRYASLREDFAAGRAPRALQGPEMEALHAVLRTRLRLAEARSAVEAILAEHFDDILGVDRAPDPREDPALRAALRALGRWPEEEAPR